MTTASAAAGAAGGGRLGDIDMAKGLAIALVVWGHIVAGTQPLDNAWYTGSQELVYLFHMPFFMFLSGVVAGYGYRPLAGLGPWGGYVRTKMVRLMPAYALIAVVIVAGKLLASRFVYVDNLPPSLLQGIWDVFFQPNKSSSKSLWFIYVLFLFYLTIHGWMLLVRQRAAWLVACGLILELVPAPEFLLLDRYCKFFLFFVIGLNAGQCYDAARQYIDRYGGWCCALFAAALALAMLDLIGAGKVVCGLLAIPALMFGIRRLRAAGRGAWLLYLGGYSFVIYLLNTICIGVVKGIGFKIVQWDGPVFLLYAPALFIGGLFIPILIKRHIFSRMPWLDRITR